MPDRPGSRSLARLSGVTQERLAELGRGIGQVMRAGDVLVLNGPLGAGKTTLTRSLGEGLGVRGPVTSPTFVLARTHPSLVGGAPLVHVDAYRLSEGIELDDLDLDIEGSATVIEWGRDWAQLLTDQWVQIDLQPESTLADVNAAPDAAPDAAPAETRRVTITAHRLDAAPDHALPTDDFAARVESLLS